MGLLTFTSSRKKAFYGLLILLFLVMFFIRFFPLRIYHWWDEAVYLQHAEIFFSGRLNYSELSFRPPLISLIFSVFYYVWHSAVTASIITSLFGAIAPVLAFFAGKKMYGTGTGIIAGFITGFSSFFIINSNFIMTDIPAMSLIGLSFLLLNYYEKKHFIFLSGISYSLAVLTKFTSALFILVVAVFFLTERLSLKKAYYFISGASIALIPYLIWAQISLGSFAYPFIVGSAMVSDKNENTMYYLTNFPLFLSYIAIIGLILWAAAYIFSYLSGRNEGKKDKILIVWIFLFLAYLTYVPHKELRYLFPIGLPLAILSARGYIIFSRLFNSRLRIIFGALLAGYFIIAGFLVFYNQVEGRGMIINESFDEVRAADYIKGMNYTGSIYSHHNWPVLAYYSGLEVKSIWPNDMQFYSHADDILKNSGIIIVTTEVPKQPNPEWLRNNSNFTFIRSFGNSHIFYYNNSIMEPY